MRGFDVPEVLEVHVVPSEEMRMVPPLPTATYNPLEVVVVELLDDSSFSPQEMTVKLKNEIRIMYKIFLIFTSTPKVKYYHLF